MKNHKNHHEFILLSPIINLKKMIAIYWLKEIFAPFLFFPFRPRCWPAGDIKTGRITMSHIITVSGQIEEGARLFWQCRRAKITSGKNNPVYSHWKMSIYCPVICNQWHYLNQSIFQSCDTFHIWFFRKWKLKY